MLRNLEKRTACSFLLLWCWIVAMAIAIVIFTSFSKCKSSSSVGPSDNPPYPTVYIPVSTRSPSYNLSYIHSLPRSGYLVRSTGSSTWSVLVPSSSASLRLLLRGGDSSPYSLERPSTQSQKASCHYASNGGPFHADGSSVGNVIVNGRPLAQDWNTTLVGFGITRGPVQLWIVGHLGQDCDNKILHFVTGFDWLVYNGTIAVRNDTTTGAKRAPRTAIGVDSQGGVMLLVVDGCEMCLGRCAGPTLDEVAHVMQTEGALYAINMDGGGSSVLVQNGTVRSHPTCIDLPWVYCERPVSTVMCLS